MSTEQARSTNAGDVLTALVGRDRVVVWSGVVGLAGVAWLYLLHLSRSMGAPSAGAGMAGMAPQLAPWGIAELAATVAMWAVMMVGMMLPSAAPLILLFAAVNRKRRAQGSLAVPTGVFILGYLLVWGGFSVGAGFAQWGLHTLALLSPAMATTSPILAGALLIAAGVYQLSPLKEVCLARCRSPLGFLMTEWRDGVAGALRMGWRHGAYCLGCCWLLMGLLFVTGVMNLLWVAVIAFFVLLEKVAPGGVIVGRVGSAALILAGIVMLGRATGMGGM
jgi:predicted metal-binding membrane protein